MAASTKESENDQVKSKVLVGSRRCHAGIHGLVGDKHAKMQLSLLRILVESEVWWCSISRSFPNPREGPAGNTAAL
jgi:hypothetical protein